MTCTRQNGFTLVELAISLMVIGLLIGGVLKGQELIENARVTATIRQLKSYDTATMIFRNTYNALPGDIRSPNRIPNCTADLCSRAGNGNRMVLWADSTSTGAEVYNFFSHMTKAGMIQGPTGTTNTNPITAATAELVYPLTPFDTPISLSYLDGTVSNHIYLLPANIDETEKPLPTKAMMSIDTKLDDGYPTQGDIVLNENDVCPIDCSSSPCVYDIQGTANSCYMQIKSGF